MSESAPVKVTAPGSTDTAAKKVKKTVPAHPLVGSEDREVYPFKDVPADYTFGAMRPLKKKDFIADHVFMEFQAQSLEAKAADIRKKAAEAKAVGGNKDKGAQKRLLKMAEQMEALKQRLAAQGVDVGSLLADAAK